MPHQNGLNIEVMKVQDLKHKDQFSSQGSVLTSTKEVKTQGFQKINPRTYHSFLPTSGIFKENAC